MSTQNNPINVSIEKTSYHTVTDEADPNDEWSCDSTDCHHDVGSLREVKDRGDFIFTPNKIQDEYFLVYATYSTGDTFHSEGGCFQPIAIYSDYQSAEKTKSRLEDWTKEKKDESEYNTIIQLEDGSGGFKDFQFHVPWIGYFEHLEEIEIKKLLLHRRVK